jgi:ParB-like chromosome segregation protein Spo0J
MQMELSINPELEKWIIPLTVDEFEQLTKSVLEDGCREPLVVWGHTLVDGHNRFRICTKHGVEFKTVQKDFESVDAAKDWMVRNQLGRRNVTPEQRDYLIGKIYKESKCQGQRNDLTYRQNDEKLKTSQQIADQFNVSSRTVERAERFADALDTVAENCGEQIKNSVLNRRHHVTKSNIMKMSKLPADKQRHVMAAVQNGKHAKDAMDNVFGEPPEKPRIPDMDSSEILRVPCGNPRCSNDVITTRKQYKKFVGVWPEKYGRLEIMYCSNRCRDIVLFRMQANLAETKVKQC